MTALARIGSLALFLLAGACGGSSGGSSAVTGTVHGQSISVKDAISASVTTTDDDRTIHTAAIVMGNASDLCADAMSNRTHPNAQAVLMQMADVNGATISAPTAPGTYTIFTESGAPPAKAAMLSVSVVDAACKGVEAQSASATSGTITLTAVSGDKFSGHFDITLDSNDHVTGSFDPGECPELQTRLNSSSDPTCL